MVEASRNYISSYSRQVELLSFDTMTSTSFYTLFESASGYALFSVLENEEIGSLLQEVSCWLSKDLHN